MPGTESAADFAAQWGGQSNGAIDVNQGDTLFGQITATNTQRHIQFALRFMF